ncbi:aromatic acid/H+ symport family MFS transporter [Sphingomonas oligophenolica]|uniref:MFS transporter n=1 Tax=Sphingomonas oligophenolica TaxID=301154 RepID=A0ABU9XYZ5_9SPHN
MSEAIASDALPTGKLVDVAALIEGQRPSRFILWLILLSCAVTLFDGFDMLVISFVAPYIRAEFGADPVTLGQLFGCGTAGAMAGGFAFGWLGDRIGRRPSIIISVVAFGITSMALALAHTLTALMLLRVLNGFALGGLMPLAWALNIEFVPRRFRATVVTLIMMGYTLGGALAGPVTVWLAPYYGWQGVFLSSGAITLLLVPLLIVALPESPRYLTARRGEPGRVAAILNRLQPGLGLTAEDRFVLGDEINQPDHIRFRLPDLFKDRLAKVTPLLWLAYIGSSMAIYFKTSWGPIIFEDVGFTRADAAYISSLSALGGAVAGLLLMRFTDRFGPIAIAILPVLTVPMLLVMGSASMSHTQFALVSFASMTLIGGAHFGMHSIAGMFYPSAIRANGGGWATSIAKIGSIGAPLVAGYLLAAGLPPRESFMLLAFAPALTAVTLLLLGRMFIGRRAAEQPSLSPA